MSSETAKVKKITSKLQHQNKLIAQRAMYRGVAISAKEDVNNATTPRGVVYWERTATSPVIAKEFERS